MNNPEISKFIQLLHNTDDYGQKLDKLLETAKKVPETHDEMVALINLGSNKPLYETRKVNLMFLASHISRAKFYVDPNKRVLFV